MQLVSSSSSVLYQPMHFPDDFPFRHLSYVQNNIEKPLFHYHDCLELGLCVHGSGVEMIDYRPYAFSNNTLSIIHKNCLHDSKILIANDYQKRSEWQFIFVDIGKLNLPEDNYGFISHDPTLVELFQIMYKELENNEDHYKDIFKELLEALLLIARRQVQNRYISEAPKCPPEIIEAINYITHFYREDISIDELTQRSNMSKSTFYRAFTASAGITPMAFLLNTRLTVASSLLKSTNMSIVEIAEYVGFNSLSSFNRQFMKQYHCPPSSFRKKLK